MNTERNSWRAGCGESCTSGSVGGSGKSAPSSILFDNGYDVARPGPTQHVETSLDLNEHLIKHPSATFFVQVSGDSMRGAGIHNDDILVVDRSLKAKHNSIVIAVLNGELAVKRLKIYPDKCVLASENPAYKDIIITPEMDFTVWGVVTSVVHQFI